ncbi:hypothetical protein IFM89_017724 [Coptis chinensis]|uniref:NAD-dependent epimerase/dehydratase domain-containing protein n=1 Tax=Coptis chinensis TaxID=261450 RepID=A0A835HFW6_9MAGN|nr:hypothetical protein IFM89_017724 [Coptis chinensis]
MCFLQDRLRSVAHNTVFKIDNGMESSSTLNSCQGVFYTASPVRDDPEQMVEPAVNGTKFVIDAAAETGVCRVVCTSSIGAVTMDPNRGPDVVVDESCWSDLDFCKMTKLVQLNVQNWYCYDKAVVEQAAWEMAKEKGVDLVVVNPLLVMGPLLQPIVNASIVHILKYLTGSAKTYANSVQTYVHVRDVALAHILVYETPASGRYLCAKRVLHRSDVVEILAKFFPEYPIPTKESMNCKSCKNMVLIPSCSNYYGYGIMHSYRFYIMEKDLAGKFLRIQDSWRVNA